MFRLGTNIHRYDGSNQIQNTQLWNTHITTTTTTQKRYDKFKYRYELIAINSIQSNSMQIQLSSKTLEKNKM